MQHYFTMWIRGELAVEAADAIMYRLAAEKLNPQRRDVYDKWAKARSSFIDLPDPFECSSLFEVQFLSFCNGVCDAMGFNDEGTARATISLYLGYQTWARKRFSIGPNKVVLIDRQIDDGEYDEFPSMEEVDPFGDGRYTDDPFDDPALEADKLADEEGDDGTDL